jgi:hypothetical protein
MEGYAGLNVAEKQGQFVPCDLRPSDLPIIEFDDAFGLIRWIRATTWCRISQWFFGDPSKVRCQHNGARDVD